MAKNRKNQARPVRLGPALKAFLLCALIGGAGVGYVWLKNQIYALGEQKVRAEKDLESLKRQNNQRMQMLAERQTHSEIEARVRQMNLGLVPPQPDQMVRLVEMRNETMRGEHLLEPVEQRWAGMIRRP
jgi:uncharacterized protein HemX